MTFADQVQHYLSPRRAAASSTACWSSSTPSRPSRWSRITGEALSYLAQDSAKRALVVIFTDLSGGGEHAHLVSQAALLAKRSLPLVVTISDPDIHAAARQRPDDSLSTYQRTVASQTAG